MNEYITFKELTNYLEIDESSVETFKFIIQEYTPYSEIGSPISDDFKFKNSIETWRELCYGLSGFCEEHGRQKLFDEEYYKCLSENFENYPVEIKSNILDEIGKLHKYSTTALLEILHKMKPEILNSLHSFTNQSATMQKEEKGFVYLANLDNEKGLIKIGKTNNITQRESTFVTGNIHLKIFAYVQCENPYELENFLHKFFKNKQVKNEWFSLTDDDVQLLVELFDFKFAVETK